AAWEMVKPWSREDREFMRREVPRLGLATPYERTNLYDIAAQAVGIAEAGLVRRGIRNARGEDESIHMAPLEETIRLAKSPAERWLDLYDGEWGGDLTRIFKAAEM